MGQTWCAVAPGTIFLNPEGNFQFAPNASDGEKTFFMNSIQIPLKNGT
jgi:hypothetical protein